MDSAGLDPGVEALDMANLSTDDFDFSFEDPIDVDILDVSQSEPVPAAPLETPSVTAPPGSAAAAARAYHSKRPHKKSRAGCNTCKRRKVKCDEARPSCRACTLRRETCVYPENSPPAPPAPAAKASRSSSVVRSRGSSPSSVIEIDPSQVVYKEPLFCPAQMNDAVDMRMLWFYSTETYSSFALEARRSPSINHVLRVKIVEHAFSSPFLMDCLLGLASLQCQHVGQPIPPQRAAAYQTRAFQGYRKAIEAAKPKDYPALLACSLLMAALSSQTFRSEDSRPLYIVEWIQVWRGIGLIVDLISPASIIESGLAVLFYRPPIDLQKTTKFIPNNLLFMVSSIKQDDPDHANQKTYYDVLKYLGSLYMELEHGFSPILDLRVITWSTFLPRDFMPLAREYKPRALVIIAHYLCFVKLNRNVWWMEGISDKEILAIAEKLGDEWAHLLRIPLKVRQTTSKPEIAQMIIDNHNWAPGENDLYESRVELWNKDLRLIDNEGNETEVVDNTWRLKASGMLWAKMKEGDPNAAETLDGDQTLLGFRPAELSAADKAAWSARVDSFYNTGSESPPSSSSDRGGLGSSENTTTTRFTPTSQSPGNQSSSSSLSPDGVDGLPGYGFVSSLVEGTEFKT